MAIFKGAGVAIVTPMHEDLSINYDKLEELLEEQIAAGTDAIIICGTTGESATLSEEEHLEAIKFTIDKVAKRIPVIAGRVPTVHTQQSTCQKMPRNTAQTDCLSLRLTIIRDSERINQTLYHDCRGG